MGGVFAVRMDQMSSQLETSQISRQHRTPHSWMTVAGEKIEWKLLGSA